MKKAQQESAASIDSSFITQQRDLFESGLVASIGANAFAVWCALKYHADFSTGRAFPGVRRLAELVGLNKDTVSKCLHTLSEARLLRSTPRGRGKAYVARERLDVRLGSVVVCSIVVDYIPSRIRQKILAVERAIESGAGFDDEAFAEVEIIPGPQFEWDPESKSLKGKLPARELASQQPVTPGAAREEFRQLLDRMRKKLPKK